MRNGTAGTRRGLLVLAALGAPGFVASAAADACSDAAQAASALLERYVAIVNAHDPARFAEVCAEDYVQHSGRSGNGLPAQVENFRGVFARWPDIAVTVEDRIFGDGKLVARNLFAATHTQTVLGVAPTGRRVSFRTIDVWRVAGGKLAEHWDIVDVAGLEKQLRGT